MGAEHVTRRLAGARILLVEDEDDLRDLEDVVLEAEGARVVAVSCAEEALVAAATETFDLVVTDLSLPQLDGYGLLDRLHAGRPALPVVALTGRTGPEERARALARGFAEHIAKPVTPDELVRSVASARGTKKPDA